MFPLFVLLKSNRQSSGAQFEFLPLADKQFYLRNIFFLARSLCTLNIVVCRPKANCSKWCSNMRSSSLISHCQKVWTQKSDQINSYSIVIQGRNDLWFNILNSILIQVQTIYFQIYEQSNPPVSQKNYLWQKNHRKKNLRYQRHFLWYVFDITDDPDKDVFCDIRILV